VLSARVLWKGKTGHIKGAAIRPFANPEGNHGPKNVKEHLTIWTLYPRIVIDKAL